MRYNKLKKEERKGVYDYDRFYYRIRYCFV